MLESKSSVLDLLTTPLLNLLTQQTSAGAGGPGAAHMLLLEVEHGAGDETRTRDIDHGKVVLYQLSYPRIAYY